MAQTDSAAVQMQPAVLSDSVIIKFPPPPPEDLFVSATRYPENREQLPFTTYVVTAEEILRNGYVTLADVLKYVPGIRVSQPGNALEGETFMMRGLAGNQYVKVLINDVPVKPGAALGMPIGAQLPIRQAERIEILYGPAGAVYGSDACAGVINIILKESERPLFTQADLSFGALGYNSLDLMFGGKIGKDKKIFRFSLYGSSTVREKTDVFYDENLLNPNRYLPFGLDSSVFNRPNFGNYVPDPTNKNLPKTSNFAHESRLFGVQLNWRGIQFGYQRMARFDHSALGQSPLAYVYANPSTRVSERMETFSMGFQSRIGKLRTKNTISLLSYQLDNTSSSLYVFDQVGAAYYHYLNPDGQAKDSVLRGIWQNLYSGERYVYANTLDARFDTRFRLSLGERLSLDMGGFFQIYGGYAGTHYLERPFEGTVLRKLKAQPIQPKPFQPLRDEIFEGNIFPNLKWQNRRLTVLVGTALNTSKFSSLVLAPRLAYHFQLDTVWSVRAIGSTGFRQPPMWGASNNYIFSPQGITQTDSALYLGKTEKIRSAEFGLRFSKKRLHLDASFFYQSAHNQARNGYLITDSQVLGANAQYYGWANAPDLSQSLWGLQFVASAHSGYLHVDLVDRRPLTFRWRNEISLQYARGRELFGHGVAPTEQVRQLPPWMWQFRTAWQGEKSELVLSTVRQFAWLGGGVFYEKTFERQVQKEVSGYATWDIMFRLRLSQHFRVYVQMQNVFNREYGGLDATGTPDDLLWNPQQGRLSRFGIVYSMQ